MTRPRRLALPIILLALVAIGCEREQAEKTAVSAAVPDTFRFHDPDELRAFFNEADYSLERWDEGERGIPRFYLAHVPSRWRTDVGPSLPPAVKKRYFFFVYAPLVLAANEEIQADRTRLHELLDRDDLDEDDLTWLRDLAGRYRLEPPPAGPLPDTLLMRLQRRVDIIPPSLALAQAAVESGWSTSRFADQGNALFGQWTWSDDGMTPYAQRRHLGNYGVKAFPSPAASIAAYMRNLNTHPGYQELRARRAALRARGALPRGSALAPTLTAYSEEGEDYVRRLASVIRVNRLAAADEAHLRAMRPVMLIPVGEGAD